MSPLSLGGAEPMARSREDSSIPLVPVTQVCSHQSRVFPQPLALGQGGAVGSGPGVLFQGWGWGSLSPAGCNEDACRTVATIIMQSCRSHLQTKSAPGMEEQGHRKDLCPGDTMELQGSHGAGFSIPHPGCHKVHVRCWA